MEVLAVSVVCVKGIWHGHGPAKGALAVLVVHEIVCYHYCDQSNEIWIERAV